MKWIYAQIVFPQVPESCDITVTGKLESYNHNSIDHHILISSQVEYGMWGHQATGTIFDSYKIFLCTSITVDVADVLMRANNRNTT